MPESHIELSVRRVEPKLSVIDIKGDLTAFAENTLMQAYTEATPSGVNVVILNFTGLEYMNSSGIGLLVTLMIRMNRQKQRLLAYGLSEHYEHIFELTRLNEAILTFDSESEAIAGSR